MNALRSRAAFQRELATLLDSGISLRESLTALAPVHPAARRALDEVDRGGSLAESLAREKLLPAEAALLRASERSGMLPSALHRLAGDAEAQARARSRAIGGFLYPAILAGLAAFLLPVGTLIRSGLGAYLRTAVFSVALFAVGAVLVVLVLRGTRSGTGFQDRFLLGLPLLGPLQRAGALSRIADAFSLLAGAGIPLPETIRTAAESSGSATYGGALLEAEKRVARGASLSAETRRTGVFPATFLAFLDTGERTGDLQASMDRAKKHFHEEWERALDSGTRYARGIIYTIVVLGVAWQIFRGLLAAFTVVIPD